MTKEEILDNVVSAALIKGCDTIFTVELLRFSFNYSDKDKVVDAIRLWADNNDIRCEYNCVNNTIRFGAKFVLI
jgi:hypothetical protein